MPPIKHHAPATGGGNARKAKRARKLKAFFAGQFLHFVSLSCLSVPIAYAFRVPGVRKLLFDLRKSLVEKVTLFVNKVTSIVS